MAGFARAVANWLPGLGGLNAKKRHGKEGLS
jgi:hypothetical protein